MKVMNAAVVADVALAVAACSPVYKSNPRMNYYHGQTIPAGYIKVLRASPSEIAFEIRVEFVEKKLYHLVLDGDTAVADGWVSTLRAGQMSYTAIMTPKEGLAIEPGKTYRLCIGQESPEAAQMRADNYPCVVDFTFVFRVQTDPKRAPLMDPRPTNGNGWPEAWVIMGPCPT